MEEALKNLAAMEYPGRLIILGLEPSASHCVIIYAITGRSSSSQARKLELKDNRIWTRPTDEEALKKGNVDLLVYPALSLFRSLAVSNGKQTADVEASWAPGLRADEVLKIAHAKWSYEPDEPNYTPRISGTIVPGPKAALAIIRRSGDGSTERAVFPLRLDPGKGKLLSTYAGQNADPLPSFPGEPLDVEIRTTNAAETAEDLYGILQPAYRVSVACVFADVRDPGLNHVFIINRHDRE
jgi:IMP cyclohydrolase